MRRLRTSFRARIFDTLAEIFDFGLRTVVFLGKVALLGAAMLMIIAGTWVFGGGA